MNKDLIRKLYFNSWVRIPIKFIIVFSSIKIGYDYYEYRTAWRTRRGNPRSVNLFQTSSDFTNNLQSLLISPLHISSIRITKNIWYLTPDKGYQTILYSTIWNYKNYRRRC